VRQHFIAQVRGGETKLTPAEIQRKTAAVLAVREMRANLDDFRARGAPPSTTSSTCSTSAPSRT
jgi:hypothetical protein